MANFDETLRANLADLSGMIFNICGDHSSEEAIEILEEMRKEISKKMEELQYDIDVKVEEISDSFGEGITLRQLKGE